MTVTEGLHFFLQAERQTETHDEAHRCLHGYLHGYNRAALISITLLSN